MKPFVNMTYHKKKFKKYQKNTYIICWKQDVLKCESIFFSTKVMDYSKKWAKSN